MIALQDNSPHKKGQKEFDYDRELEEELLSVFPKSIKDFILYEARIDASVSALVPQLEELGEEGLLRYLRRTQDQWSKYTYGPTYPCPRRS